MKVFWCCRRAIGRNWGLRPQNLMWLHTAIVRPMLAYGSFIWWRGTDTAINCKRLNHLQRSICLAITGAAKTAPQLVLEMMLHLPKLETYILAEAKVTALRYRTLIKGRYSWRKDHSSIMENICDYNQTLRAPVDHLPPKYVFDRHYRVVITTPAVWAEMHGNNDPLIDRWFIETSIKGNVSGYGIYNQNTSIIKYTSTSIYKYLCTSRH